MSQAVAQYKVVPFTPVVKEKDASAAVARQLDRLIATYAEDGWRFREVTNIVTVVNRGCLGFGPNTQETINQVVFERPAFKG